MTQDTIQRPRLRLVNEMTAAHIGGCISPPSGGEVVLQCRVNVAAQRETTSVYDNGVFVVLRFTVPALPRRHLITPRSE